MNKTEYIHRRPPQESSLPRLADELGVKYRYSPGPNHTWPDPPPRLDIETGERSHQHHKFESTLATGELVTGAVVGIPPATAEPTRTHDVPEQ